jgi:hypothetical protein
VDQLDAILRLVVTIAIYVVIFAVIGIAFYEIDKRFKMWVARNRASSAAQNAPQRPARRTGKRSVRRSARRRA